jgi:UDP-GlcNAc:undecaprenyl-phosphate GlcNAc-1-phosphate transferase
MFQVVLLAVAGAFALSFVLTLLMRRFARKIGFVDRPGGHKGHDKPVALGGGVAIFIATLIPVIGSVFVARWALSSGDTAWMPTFVVPHVAGIAGKLHVVLAIFAGALVLHVLGLIDDVRPLGPGLKLIAQLVVVLILVVIFGVRAVEAAGTAISIIVTTVWLVLIINAFNFLDNMDGLCAGVASIALAIFAASSMVTGQIFVPTLAWVLVGALLGFLVFNFSPASIFMGDAGSMVVGYLTGLLTILTTYYDPGQQLHPTGVLTPLVVLAVPLYDVASVVLHRLRLGESPFRGDRRHFSHRLVRRGMSTRAAVMTIYLATAATGVSAILLPHASWPGAVLIFTQTICIVLIVAILEHAPMRGGSTT